MTERQAGEKLQQIILELGFSLGLKLFSLDSNQSSIMFCFQGCLRGKGLSWRLQFKLFWFVSNGHLLCESSPIYKKYIILDWFKSCLQLQNFESSFQGKGWRFSGVGGELLCSYGVGQADAPHISPPTSPRTTFFTHFPVTFTVTFSWALAQAWCIDPQCAPSHTQLRVWHNSVHTPM